MKAILLSFALLPIFASAQIRTGTWSDNGVIIERNDTVQYEHHNGRIDTLAVSWVADTNYRLVGAGKTVSVHITRVFEHGYSGYAICNGRKQRFEFIRVGVPSTQLQVYR